MQIKMKATTTLLALFFMFAMVVAAVPMGATAAAISVSLLPNHGPVGTEVDVSGTATPGMLVKIYWDDIVPDNLLGTTKAAAIGGAYSCTVTIPTATAGGAHSIYAVDVTTSGVTGKTFSVTPEIALTPVSGLVGDAVDVTGTGFAADSDIAISFGYPAVRLIESGTSTAAWYSDPNPNRGEVVKAVGGNYMAGAGVYIPNGPTLAAFDPTAISFNYNGTAPTRTPALELRFVAPDCGDPDDATSFNIGHVDITIDSQGAIATSGWQTTAAYATTSMVVFYGNVPVTGVAFSQATTLTLTAAISDMTTNHGVVSTTWVLTRITPQVGYDVVGTYSIGNVSYNGVVYDPEQSIATGTTDSSGILTATFDVPAGRLSGTYTVSAIGESDLCAHALFTVTPEIVLEPTYGQVGDMISVTGTGFAATTQIPIFFGDAVRVQLIQSGASKAKWGTDPAASHSRGAVVNLTAALGGPMAGAGVYIPAGTALTTLATFDPKKVSFEYYGVSLTYVPTLELRFVDPDSVSPDGAGHVDITFVNNGTFTTTAWHTSGAYTKNLPLVQYYGNDPVTGVAFSDSTPGTLTAAKNALVNGTYDCGDWVLTRITPQVGYDIAGSYSIGNVTYNSVKYNLEPPIATGTTSASGVLATHFHVPVGTAAGTYTVSAMNKTDLFANADLEVVAVVDTAIALDSYEGASGAVVEITGEGFGLETDFNVTIDGLLVLEGTTDIFGEFSENVYVPTLAIGTYDVVATDADGGHANASPEFNVTATTEFGLIPDAAPSGCVVVIAGVYFSADSWVDIVLYNATDASIETWEMPTDEDGLFAFEWTVDLELGVYFLNATDQNGLDLIYVNEVQFEVVDLDVEIYTRAATYLQGDTISFYIASDFIVDGLTEIAIADPTDYPYGTITIFPWDWVYNGSCYAVPYWATTFVLPGGAEIGTIGTWTWTADINGVERTGDFEVTEVFTIAMVLAHLDELDAEIIALDGVVATISTTVGDIQTSVDSIGLTVTSIEGDVATIQTTLGTIQGKIVSMNGTVATIQTNLGKVQVDVSDIKGSFPAPMWAAVILSLIAAMGVIYVVIRMRKPAS